MRLSGDTFVYAATDISNHLACPHLTTLEFSATRGGPKAPMFDDPGAEVLRQRGHEHEARVLEGFRARGLSVREAERPGWNESAWSRAAKATLGLMQEGADVIYQGTLFDGEWLGRPDFLRRVESGLVSWEIGRTRSWTRSSPVRPRREPCCRSASMRSFSPRSRVRRRRRCTWRSEGRRRSRSRFASRTTRPTTGRRSVDSLRPPPRKASTQPIVQALFPE